MCKMAISSLIQLILLEEESTTSSSRITIYTDIIKLKIENVLYLLDYHNYDLYLFAMDIGIHYIFRVSMWFFGL